MEHRRERLEKYSRASKTEVKNNTMAQVIVKPNESLETALKRFKKQIQQDGILKQARAHEFYEKPSDKRRKLEAARRRKAKQTEEK
jgi:small subunit ribosomal protein S21